MSRVPTIDPNVLHRKMETQITTMLRGYSTQQLESMKAMILAKMKNYMYKSSINNRLHMQARKASSTNMIKRINAEIARRRGSSLR